MNLKISLTGDRPTGKLHLGHYVGSLLTRLKLQDHTKQLIMIADMQALTDNAEDPQKIINNTKELLLDYLAVGLDIEKNIIFRQSQIIGICELYFYFMNLVTEQRLKQNPTVKNEILLKSGKVALPVGFLTYPVHQAADIAIFKSHCVPVGSDQLPMIEFTNELVRKFNRIYNTNALQECEAILSNTKRLMGIDGKHKASKSLNNAIFLSDPEEVLKQKVKAMYTDPGHLKITDPGQVKGNVVFEYLDIFHHDKAEIAKLKTHYQQGGLGDMAVKKILFSTLNTLLTPIRTRRLKLEKNIDIMQILKTGERKANEITHSTMNEIKQAIGLI